MTVGRGDDARRVGTRRRRVSAGVLADRMAATLVHHEPGWRLPRLTAMARRFNVSAAEVDAAIDELAARHLLRRLPDGQVYRASPAEYRVSLEGLSGLSSHVDPMGGQLACRSRQVSRRRPPEDIGRSLELEAGDPVLVIRCVWTVGGEPAALSVSYLPERLGQPLPDLAVPPFGPPGASSAAGGPPVATGAAVGPPEEGPAAEATTVEATTAEGTAAEGMAAEATAAEATTAEGTAVAGPVAGPGPAAGAGGSSFPAGGRARALQVELAPPPSSAARSLRLGAGEMVATVSVSFEDPDSQRPVAITTAMLRPDLFRIVIQAAAAPGPGSADGFASVWSQALQGWEP